MTVSLILLIAAGVMIAGGVYLITDRTLTRIIIGLSLLANGINIFLLSQGGPSGKAPILEGEFATLSDPLPQAMILTAIVLGLATTAFGLALAYRSWRLLGHDEVTDDVEDRRLAGEANTTEWAHRLDLEVDLDALKAEKAARAAAKEAAKEAARAARAAKAAPPAVNPAVNPATGPAPKPGTNPETNPAGGGAQ